MIRTRLDSPGKSTLSPISILIHLLLLGALIFTLIPILFMFTASMMPRKDILKMPYRWIPQGFEVQNFIKAIAGNDGSFIFIRNYINSILVSGIVTFSTVLLASLTGYGLAKFKFKGRNFVFLAIMATMMIPFEAIMIPLYLVTTKLHLQNSYGGLTLPFLVNAFGVFMMRQYLLPFPDEFLDATRIDGAGEIRIFWHVVLPNCAPAIATLSILTFRSQWDNLLWPLLIAQSEKMKTLPLYIVKFAAEKYTDEGAMMAVAVLASIPMLVLFFTMSNYFVSGASVFSSRKG
ncbi:carbohydrate ABC transporter permease [Oceanispirochaeta crateris]|uniref:sn-glycerol-3-phosphate transport system permease protein UgpE n=1 Tax=Oceanispirochaeta crateris TaxID=2518645 RepID=A0A5C1QKF6_9SPIO|nr:carbohydrate ABC transporter permease [Oceanispirochaeta crateris]QEN08081.1 carbohydrate ABC transporter permease [Oceanispirochaeta crateris]